MLAFDRTGLGCGLGQALSGAAGLGLRGRATLELGQPERAISLSSAVHG